MEVLMNRVHDLKIYDEDEAENLEEAREGGFINSDQTETAKFIIADDRERLAKGQITLEEAEEDVGDRVASVVDFDVNNAMATDDDNDEIDR
jgi:hypothetical protein